MALDSCPLPVSILVVAPQPFFQNRGTPIAVRLLVEELARLGYEVHLLVFHEGEEVALSGVRLHRIAPIPGIKNIPPSLSWKKIVCDIFMMFKVFGLIRRHRFTLVHAVEEAAFMALAAKVVFATPYVYDMDSSLAQQIVEKFSFFKPLGPVLRFFEGLAIKGSCGVVAVCRALEEIALAYDRKKPVVRLEDISLLDDGACAGEDLRQGHPFSGPLMLYVGNLEKYQGIDLLLQSFQLALNRGCRAQVVIIGGTPESIAAYKKYAEELQVAEFTTFCGPRPVEMLGHYLSQADILLSPRIQGNNTPMKLYSYLDSGKPVLATNLPTHTQVLTAEFACLVEPSKESMAAGMVELVNDPEKRLRLGARGRSVARENYSLKAYQAKLSDFYRRIFTGLPGCCNLTEPKKNS
jgi:glycosyltransferase involved in cell wall biosynthesis